MDELKGLIRDLDGDVRGLRKESDQRERAQRTRDRRRDAFIGFLIVCVLVVGLFVWRFVAYSDCQTDRTKALTGPGNSRTTELIDAFAAILTVAKLTPAEHAADLRFLTAAKKRYPLLEDNIPALGKLTDNQLATYTNLIQALDANAAYAAQAKDHPVCSLWSVS